MKIFKLSALILLLLTFSACSNEPTPPLPTINVKAEKNILNVGESTKLIIIEGNSKALSFSVDNEILKLEGDTITALKAGNGSITITHSAGLKEVIEIKVLDTFDVKLKASSLKVGERATLITSTTHEDKTFQFTSLNNLITIDDDGVITAIKPGHEEILITHKSGFNTTLSLEIIPVDYNISADSINKDINAEGETFKYIIKKGYKDAPYTIDNNATFISYTIEKGDGEDIINISVAKNNARLDRKAVLKVKDYRGKEKATITLIQKMNLASPITYYWLGGVNDNSSAIITPSGDNNLYKEVKETKDTLFYNARKASQSSLDWNMCGTYSASNLIHWFLTQNEDNIKRYKEINNITSEEFAKNDYDYTRPTIDISSVAKYYQKANFMSQFPRDAIQWLLAGKKLEGYPDGPAWFKDVLQGKTDRYISYNTTYNKAELEEVVLNAYEKGAVLSFNYYYIPKDLHELNIWAFGKDMEGNIVEFIIADSNNSESKLYNFGLYYNLDNSFPYHYNLTVDENHARTNKALYSFTTLYDGKDLFEEYFASKN